MITTVTLNPMLDKTVYVDAVRPGKIVRATRVETIVGGKGINVSRQLHRLGADTLATGFAGGEIGALLDRLLGEEGVSHGFVRVAGMTREGVTYRDTNNMQTSIFEPPHRVSPEEAETLVSLCRTLIGKSAWVVCSGSSPSPQADDIFREVVTIAREAGIPSVLDSYGNAFRRALPAVPVLIKPNKEEYEQTFDERLEHDDDFRSALDTLLRLGITYCLITSGSSPFYAATRDGMWKVIPPAIKTVNATGSGDSMVAGILFGLTHGWDFERCLRFGAAAGAANASAWAVASSDREQIEALEGGVEVVSWN
jgi:1-phosphofructokinase family hexose kinase